MKTSFVRIASLVTWFGLFTPLALPAAQSQPAADLIIRNAKIWTVDKSHPTAQAVAVLDDRIVAVGSNDRGRSLARPAHPRGRCFRQTTAARLQ